MTHADATAAAPAVATRKPIVGVVGTGHMGGAMATRLRAVGFDVVIHNRTRDRAEALADRIGATVGDSPAALASSVDVLITMLADDAAVTGMYRDSNGILEGLTERTVAVDMSTVLPDTLRAIAPDIQARHAGVIDAPVSGSVTLAESGQLTIMAGGDASDLDRARPALEALSSRIFHLGPLGSGTTMKLAVNAIVFGLSEAVAEALVLAERSGVDRATAYEVFANSAIAAPFVGYKRAAFVEPATAGVAFSIDLARKDLGLIADQAGRVGAVMPQARINAEVLDDAAGDVGGDRDMASVAEHLRGRRAGMA